MIPLWVGAVVIGALAVALIGALVLGAVLTLPSLLVIAVAVLGEVIFAQIVARNWFRQHTTRRQLLGMAVTLLGVAFLLRLKQ